MADLFGKTAPEPTQPITADTCKIFWDGADKQVATAINFSLEYSQGVTRRRSIGNKSAIIYGGQPQGRATIGRLVTLEGDLPWNSDSWKACKGGFLIFELGGNCQGGKSGAKFKATQCIVSSFSLQANAEDLTVADNVVIDFMELTRTGN